MNLTSAQLAELNALLMEEKLDVPSFRLEVTSSGGNYHWLQKHLTTKNPNISVRLKQLLGIQ